MSNKTDTPVTIKDLLANSVKRMRWGGIGPKNRTVITVTYGSIILIINIIVSILQGIYLYINSYSDQSTFMYDITVFVGYWQLISKCITLSFKYKAISKLIHMNNTKFWTLDMDILTKGQKQEIQSIYDYVKIVVRFYANAILIAFFGHCVKAYLGGERSLVLNIWLPKSAQDIVYTSPGHEIFFIIQAIIMGLGEVSCLIECDCIFIISIASVIGQIRMIKFRLSLIGNNFSDDENILNLVEIIKQHNIIYEYLKTTENIFSQAMLQVLGSNLLVMVLCLFACLTDTNIYLVVVYIVYFLCIATQVFLFCLVGQYIQDEAFSIAEAAYKCKWEDVFNKNVRIMIIMIVKRAQKQVNITMGGVLILCLETFTKVSRTMLSLVTFMLNTQTQSNLK